MSRKVIYYHKGCWDGFCAAYLFYKVHGADHDYIPVQYGNDANLELCKDKEVFILDFSFPEVELRAIASVATRVVILDHHDTAEKHVTKLLNEDVVQGVFDQRFSGAMLTHHWLIEAGAPDWGPQIMDLVEYVQDRDLWTWKMPDSKEFNTGLRAYPLDFGVWDGLMATKCVVSRLIIEGTSINKYRHEVLEHHKSKAIMLDFHGVKVPFVLCTTPEIISDLGHLLDEKHPFAMIGMPIENGLSVSLRSREEFGYHVGEIAEQYGGGGHPRSASFVVSGGWQFILPTQPKIKEEQV